MTLDASIDPTCYLHRMMVATIVSESHSLRGGHKSAIRNDSALGASRQTTKVLRNHGGQKSFGKRLEPNRFGYLFSKICFQPVISAGFMQ